MSIGVRLNDPAQLKTAIGVAEQYAMMVHASAVIATRNRGSVNYQVELPPSMWQFYTRSDVDGDAIGLAEQRVPVRFTMDDAPHAIFAGASNSGKTEAIKSALVAMATTMTPEQIRFVVIDSNSQLKPDFHNMAHLMLPIADRDIDNAVKFAYAMFLYRRRSNITTSHAIAIVVDEVADLVAKQEHLAMLQMIAKQGRKYRVYLMLGSQKPTHSKLPEIIDNVLNRFVGQVSDANMSANLTGHAGLAAHRLTGKGDFIHVVNGKATRFQVAMAEQGDFEKIPRRDVKMVHVPDYALTGNKKPSRRGQPPITPIAPLRKGRPENKVVPETLAHYMVGATPSFRAAKAAGISRPKHILHRDFAAKLQAAMNKLIEEKFKNA